MVAIRWVMSHLVVVLLVVALGVGFVFREEIAKEFGMEDQLASLDAQLDWERFWPRTEGPLLRVKPLEKAKGDAAPVVAPDVKITPIEPKAAKAAPAVKAAPAPVKKAMPSPKPAPVVKAPKTAVPSPAQVAKPATAPADMPAPKPQPAPAAPVKIAKAAPSPMVSAPAAKRPATTVAPAASAGSLEEGWTDARRAFADGKTDMAVSLYVALAAAHPDQPDLAGELGNIYLTQGKTEEAAAQYYEAGQRMLKGSNKWRANTVLSVLNRLDPSKADALRKELFAATKTQ